MIVLLILAFIFPAVATFLLVWCLIYWTFIIIFTIFTFVKSIISRF